MTTVESPLQQEWEAWHREREEQLRTPHGWLSLTALHWLDDTPVWSLERSGGGGAD